MQVVKYGHVTRTSQYQLPRFFIPGYQVITETSVSKKAPNDNDNRIIREMRPNVHADNRYAASSVDYFVTYATKASFRTCKRNATHRHPQHYLFLARSPFSSRTTLDAAKHWSYCVQSGGGGILTISLWQWKHKTLMIRPPIPLNMEGKTAWHPCPKYCRNSHQWP